MNADQSEDQDEHNNSLIHSPGGSAACLAESLRLSDEAKKDLRLRLPISEA